MSKHEYSRLCGGTFFVLLLKAVKQRTKARDRQYGGSDGLNDTAVLTRLIRIAQADYINPEPSTFKQNTSAYKSCKISRGTYLPFDDDALVSAFDYRVKNEYSTTLSTMSDFTNTFIDIGSSDKHVHLVKALIELIITDESIADTDLLYVSSNGLPITKADFHKLKDVCLHAFLLGIWHFIIVNRKDNKIGRTTFENWHTKPAEKNAKWVYCASIGDKIARPINVITTLDAQAIESYSDDIGANTENESHDEYSESFVEEPEPNSDPHTLNQVVNTHAVFINHGPNGIQINNTGTLNIDRGGKK